MKWLLKHANISITGRKKRKKERQKYMLLFQWKSGETSDMNM